MNTHKLTYSLFLSLLTLGTTLPWSSARAEAQHLPWIGFTLDATRLHFEGGAGVPGAFDYFGFALAAGDFNGDGTDDLATGIPGNDCSSAVLDCGSVQVQLGNSQNPLAAVVTLNPAAPGAPAPAASEDRYGHALAVGDFNADGRDDLAVGIPGKRLTNSTTGSAGAVQIHYGLPAILGSILPVAQDYLKQGRNGVPGVELGFEYFGSALAVGDFNGDGHDDLAIGANRNKTGIHQVSAGNVVVAHGHAGGLLPFEGFEMEQGREGLPDTPEGNDLFGWALAAGDFNGDGYDDLAIGVPREDDVGAVLVVYGSPFSLLFNNHWWFGAFDLGGPVQAGMRFGQALAAGDFDGDGYDDLVVGIPRFDHGVPPTIPDGGLAVILHGAASGLSTARNYWFWENLVLGPGNTEAGDLFGWALTAGDFDGDGVDDLVVGSSGEDVNKGGATVLPGRRFQGLTRPARQLVPTGTNYPQGLIPDYREGAPGYGSSLVAGDFDGNGFADLVIGAPNRDIFTPTTLVDAGGTVVLYGQLFADGFELGHVGAWSSAVP